MKNISRDEISNYLNQEFGLTKKDCNDLVNDLIDEIILGLITNDIVKIHNFGTFRLRKKRPRIGRNPKTKEEVMISSRNVVTFIPSKKILNKLNSNINERQDL